MSYENRIEDDSGLASETSSLKSSSTSRLYANDFEHEAVQVIVTEPEYGSITPQDNVHIEDESQRLLSAGSENNFLRRPSLNVLRRMSQDVIRRMSQCVIKRIPTTTWEILSKTWIWSLTMFLSYVICLSVFPSITALVQSTYSDKVS